MRHSLTVPSLDPEASMPGLFGQKLTDQTIRLCADSAAASSSKPGPSSGLPNAFCVLFQMQILRSLPDDAWICVVKHVHGSLGTVNPRKYTANTLSL